MLGRSEPHFSFAGLKTAVRQQVRAAEPLAEQAIADLCAEFQAAVADSLAERVRHVLALSPLPALAAGDRRLVVAGGVAANAALRRALAAAASEADYLLIAPPPHLCTDNAAMVAWAGAERCARGWTDAAPLTARARWPLDPLASPALGGGRLGAKA
jgi:N6-L-threonylcarbamoyladenine synthase